MQHPPLARFGAKLGLAGLLALGTLGSPAGAFATSDVPVGSPDVLSSPGAGTEPGAEPGTASTPNVLLILLDDVGVDLIGAYGEHPSPANTPNLNALAAGGLLFRNVWSNPSCSPSRSTVVTGRYTFRTGLGFGTGWQTPGSMELDPDEVSIADVLPPEYTSAVVGKWHLGSIFQSGLQHPLLMGFDHHWGPMANVGGAFDNGYFDYDKNVDGVSVPNTSYATTEQTDDALTLISQFESQGTDPWFLYLACSAPHGPFHAPPANLHSYTLPGTPQQDVGLHIKAMLEALDTELGRLLAGIDPAVLAETIIFVVGDNGSATQVTTPPFDPDHAKNTVFEGGINVPFFVSGPGIPGGAECEGLVNLTDLLATVAELTGGGPVTAEDSVSIVPYFSNPALASLRPWIYSERMENGFIQPYGFWHRTVREGRYKLIHEHTDSLTPDTERLYNLLADPFETTNLLELGPLTPGQQQLYDLLDQVLDDMLINEAYVPWVDLGFGDPGTYGIPSLAGNGKLIEGEQVTIELSGALENTGQFLVLAFGQGNLPFEGGTMVPDVFSPGTIFRFIPTDATGMVRLTLPWPPGLPGDIPVYLQSWIQDPSGMSGLAGSNGLRAVTF